MNVLVVDDEAPVRQLISRMITRDYGVNVIEADDGLSALDRLLSDPIGLVVMDLSMRVMNGLETLEAIRHSQTYARIPVIIMTGRADESRVRRAVELGISGVIAKPFTRDVLRDHLSKILGAESGSPGHTGRLLNIAASHRMLVVDQNPGFRAIATQHIGRLCQVEASENEFSALKRCLSSPFELVLIGATSELSSTEAFAQKIRRTPALHAVKLVAAVASGDVAATKALGLFDAVLVRSLVPEVFERSLQRVLSEESLARLLLHSASSFVAGAFESARVALQKYMKGELSMQESASVPGGDARWVVAAAEIQSARFAWDIRLRCPFAVALEVGTMCVKHETDQVSQEEMIESVGHLVEEIGRQLSKALLGSGLKTAVSGARVSVTGIGGARPSTSESVGLRRSFLIAQQEIASIEIAPLVVCAA